METLEIYVADEIQTLLERLATHNKRAIRSAAKSLGYMMQKEIKKEVKTGAPGGKIYDPRTKYDFRAKLQGGSAAKQWYGQMLRAVGYQYKDGTLHIGWTSKTAATYGRKQEEGFNTRVTAAVRRRYEEAGFKLRRDKRYLETPARPVFEPMANVLEPQIAPYVQEKLNEYVSESVTFSKKARRRYKVY